MLTVVVLDLVVISNMGNKISLGEMFIVIVLVVMLGWITYQQFGLARAKSRDVNRKNSLNELGQIIRLYFADYGVLPEEKLINSLWGKEWKDGNYVYLNRLPQENKLKKNYCYLIENNGKSFSILADLENEADTECQKDKWRCGGQNYCYRHTLTAEIFR